MTKRAQSVFSPFSFSMPRRPEPTQPCAEPLPALQSLTNGLGGDHGPPLLAQVAVVWRSRPQLEGLPHVAQALEELLDQTGHWTLEAATKAELPHLLLRLTAQESDSKRSPDWATFRELRFLHGAIEAAKGGNLSLIQAWRAYFPQGNATAKIFEVAAKTDDVALVQWLHSQGLLMQGNHEVISGTVYSRPNVVYWLYALFPKQRLTISIDEAARRPKETFVFAQWVVTHMRRFCVSLSANAISAAAAEGHLPMVQWLHLKLGLPIQSFAIRVAYERGHLHIVRWLYDQYRTSLSPSAGRRHWDKLKQLVRQSLGRPPTKRWLSWTSDVIFEAATTGHLGMVQLLYDSANRPRDLMNAAARAGNVDIVHWLHTQGAACTKSALDGAATNGHLSVAQWLHENRSEGATTDAMDGAVRENHFAIVRWLHESRPEGCTTSAMDAAAWSGQLQMVIWLHENRSEGCTVNAMNSAAFNAHLHVVRWLHEHRTEGCTYHAMDEAAANGHLRVVQWLHEHRTEGCTAAAMDNAAAGGHLEIVQWLHAHRSEGCTERAMDQAAANGHLNIVRWLHEHRREGCTQETLSRAALGGHLQIVQYLHANRPERFTLAKYRGLYSCYPDVLEWLLEQYPEQVNMDDLVQYLQNQSVYWVGSWEPNEDE